MQEKLAVRIEPARRIGLPSIIFGMASLCLSCSSDVEAADELFVNAHRAIEEAGQVQDSSYSRAYELLREAEKSLTAITERYPDTGMGIKVGVSTCVIGPYTIEELRETVLPRLGKLAVAETDVVEAMALLVAEFDEPRERDDVARAFSRILLYAQRPVEAAEFHEQVVQYYGRSDAEFAVRCGLAMGDGARAETIVSNALRAEFDGGLHNDRGVISTLVEADRVDLAVEWISRRVSELRKGPSQQATLARAAQCMLAAGAVSQAADYIYEVVDKSVQLELLVGSGAQWDGQPMRRFLVQMYLKSGEEEEARKAALLAAALVKDCGVKRSLQVALALASVGEYEQAANISEWNADRNSAEFAYELAMVAARRGDVEQALAFAAENANVVGWRRLSKDDVVRELALNGHAIVALALAESEFDGDIAGRISFDRDGASYNSNLLSLACYEAIVSRDDSHLRRALALSESVSPKDRDLISASLAVAYAEIGEFDEMYKALSGIANRDHLAQSRARVAFAAVGASKGQRESLYLAAMASLGDVGDHNYRTLLALDLAQALARIGSEEALLQLPELLAESNFEGQLEAVRLLISCGLRKPALEWLLGVTEARRSDESVWSLDDDLVQICLVYSEAGEAAAALALAAEIKNRAKRLYSWAQLAAAEGDSGLQEEILHCMLQSEFDPASNR